MALPEVQAERRSKMILNVIMPVSRIQARERYKERFEKEGVFWRLVVDESLSDIYGDALVYRASEGEDPCYGKINLYRNFFPSASEYVTFLCDDDWIEDGYFQRIREHPQTPVIITSMKRGDNEVAGHGISTLMAHPDNMEVGKIGLEQIVMRGDVFAQERFDAGNSCADGEMARLLKVKYDCTYARDAFVLFNYFQEGRYNK